jgi:hypothetical protein
MKISSGKSSLVSLKALKDAIKELKSQIKLLSMNYLEILKDITEKLKILIHQTYLMLNIRKMN